MVDWIFSFLRREVEGGGLKFVEEDGIEGICKVNWVIVEVPKEDLKRIPLLA